MRVILASILMVSAGLSGTITYAADTTTSSAHAVYTTADTPLGDLLDNPASKAILMKHLPDLVGNEQIEMARGLTLKALQSYAADQVTDAKLAAIDAELAKLPSK